MPKRRKVCDGTSRLVDSDWCPVCGKEGVVAYNGRVRPHKAEVSVK